MDSFIGKTLGHYRITEVIGQGGMATVYKALDTHLDRTVAVKILPEQRAFSMQFVARFKREAKAMAQLVDPGIVKILDYGEQRNVLYLVMEYVPGGTLKQELGEPLPPARAARLLLPVARALQHAHQSAIIHRDIKPSNILLTETGEPLLSDFGIAKVISEETTGLTGTGVGIGTPEYMAPEQGLGRNVDHRADIYSLGIVFYELVTGVKPYTADTPLSVLLKHASEPLPSPRRFVPNLPEEIERFIYKILAKDPQNRFQDMGAVVGCLEKIAHGQKLTRDEAPPLVTVPARSRPFGGWLPFAGAGLGVILLGISIFLTLQNSILPAPTSNQYMFVTGATGDVESVDRSGKSLALRKGMSFAMSEPVTFITHNGQARLGMSDGSTVCIAQETTVKFSPDKKNRAALFNLEVTGGRFLFVGEEQIVTFQIAAPYPVTVQGKGMIFGVAYSPAARRLHLNCLDGGCAVQNFAGTLDLANGGHTWVESGMPPQPPDNPINADWTGLCSDLTGSRISRVPFPPTPTRTLTITQTSTPVPATFTPEVTLSPTASPTPLISPTQSPSPTRTRAVLQVQPTATSKPRKPDTPLPLKNPTSTSVPINPTSPPVKPTTAPKPPTSEPRPTRPPTPPPP